MNGPEDVAEAIRAHLVAAVPAELARIRADYTPALTAADLPDPALVTAQERDLVNLAEWPALFVVVQRLDSVRRVDGLSDDAETVDYRVRYPVRVFGFVRGHGYETVDLLRKRYVRAVRAVVFAGQEAVDLDDTSYIESYSDVDEDASRRTIAGFYADFVVETVEALAFRAAAGTPPDPAGWAVELGLDVLPHPALD